MKLTPHQKAFVYELLSLSARPCVIIEKVNKRFNKGAKSFKSNNLAFYQNKFMTLTPEERQQYLPYKMEDSFAVQDVRINDDIKQVRLINYRIHVEESKKEPDNKVLIDLINTGLRIKNRIGNELGQVKVLTKGGIANYNELNQLQVQINMLVNQASEKGPEDQVKYLKELFKKAPNADKSHK